MKHVSTRTTTTAAEPLFMTVRDAASRYQTSIRTIWNLVHEGVLPHIRLAGRNRVRIPIKKADDAMLANLEGGPPEKKRGREAR